MKIKREYWMTNGGLLLLESSRFQVTDRQGRPAWKIDACRITGGYHGRIWLRNLTRVQVEIMESKKGAKR